MDRIDFNIEQAEVEIDRGNDELRKAIGHQRSGCAVWFIRAEFFLVIVLSIILLVKYSH